MNLLEAISKNWYAALLCAGVLLIITGAGMYLRYYKMRRMFDNDAIYESYENGSLKEKSYRRNIWDLSIFPSLSKLFFRDDWKLAVASYLLVLFLVLYFLTREQWFADLVKVNFGLVIGALIGKKAEGSSSKS